MKPGLVAPVKPPGAAPALQATPPADGIAFSLLVCDARTPAPSSAQAPATQKDQAPPQARDERTTPRDKGAAAAGESSPVAFDTAQAALAAMLAASGAPGCEQAAPRAPGPTAQEAGTPAAHAFAAVAQAIARPRTASADGARDADRTADCAIERLLSSTYAGAPQETGGPASPRTVAAPMREHRVETARDVRANEAADAEIALTQTHFAPDEAAVASQIGAVVRDAIAEMQVDAKSAASVREAGAAGQQIDKRAPTSPSRVLVIDLAPAHLGAIRINVRLSGESVRMRVEVAVSQTVEHVREAQPELEAILARAGFEADEIVIVASARVETFSTPSTHASSVQAGAAHESFDRSAQNLLPGDEGEQRARQRRGDARDESAAGERTIDEDSDLVRRRSGHLL